MSERQERYGDGANPVQPIVLLLVMRPHSSTGVSSVLGPMVLSTVLCTGSRSGMVVVQTRPRSRTPLPVNMVAI